MTLTPAICPACVRSWQCPRAWPWLRTHFWQAKVARDGVRIDWDEGEMHAFSTTEMMQQFREQARVTGHECAAGWRSRCRAGEGCAKD